MRFTSLVSLGLRFLLFTLLVVSVHGSKKYQTVTFRELFVHLLNVGHITSTNLSLGRFTHLFTGCIHVIWFCIQLYHRFLLYITEREGERER